MADQNAQNGTLKDYVYVVRSNPVAGRDDEYNRWYTERHLADVTAVPGFVSARRFRLSDPAAEGAPAQQYMAIYTMRTADPFGLIDTLKQLVESGRIEISDAFSQQDLITILYEAMTPEVAA